MTIQTIFFSFLLIAVVPRHGHAAGCGWKIGASLRGDKWRRRGYQDVYFKQKLINTFFPKKLG